MNAFFIEYDRLLEKINGIWNNASNSIEKNLHCKHIYSKKFVKTKIRSYSD